jgi:hypothetical protein
MTTIKNKYNNARQSAKDRNIDWQFTFETCNKMSDTRKGRPSWNKGLSGTGQCQAWNKGLNKQQQLEYISSKGE